MENLHLIDRVHDMTAVEITAPATWIKNANLYGRTASELFPHDGGTRTDVIKDTKVPRYIAENLHTLGFITKEEYLATPTTDSMIDLGAILKRARVDFGIQVNFPPLIAYSLDAEAHIDKCAYAEDLLKQAHPYLGYADLLAKARGITAPTLGAHQGIELLKREGFTFHNATHISPAYLIGTGYCGYPLTK